MEPRANEPRDSGGNVTNSCGRELFDQASFRERASRVSGGGKAPTEREIELTSASVEQDLKRLRELIRDDRFDRTVRVGSELEYVLVDSSFRPKPIGDQLLLADQSLQADLSKYNVESGTLPASLQAGFLSELEQRLTDSFCEVRQLAERFGAQALLVGVLPTYERDDFEAENFINELYQDLNAGLLDQKHNKSFDIDIQGIDRLSYQHPSILIEALNTSFQLHLSLPSDQIVEFYNIVQAITAPVVAAAANASLVFGKRLWQESRIPIWEQATSTKQVPFGEDWIQSPIETLEDVRQYRPIGVDRDYLESFEKGDLDQQQQASLASLVFQNGKIWRWNRVCFGITEDLPHLRIEARFLPAGPTVPDMVANAAFFYGVTFGLRQQLLEQRGDADLSKVLPFEAVIANFRSAAQDGLDARLTWFDGQGQLEQRGARALALELTEVARSGLEQIGVPSAEADRYLKIIQDRITHDQNGAKWMERSFDSLGREVPLDERLRRITAAIAKLQTQPAPSGEILPVHKWPLLDG